jgi:hypothetical protein
MIVLHGRKALFGFGLTQKTVRLMQLLAVVQKSIFQFPLTSCFSSKEKKHASSLLKYSLVQVTITRDFETIVK